MDCTTKEERITEQGRETPVPVGEGGGRPGSPRPSSGYWSASSVANQAEGPSRETGGKSPGGQGRRSETPGEVTLDPFKRKALIGRSPPAKQRSSSMPGLTGIQDTPSGEEQGSGDKRKRGGELESLEQSKKGKMSTGYITTIDLCEDDKGISMLDEVLKKVNRDVNELATWAKERNTKKEIKDISSRLNFLMRDLRRLNESQEETVSSRKREIEKLKKENRYLKEKMQAHRNEAAVGGSRDVGSQEIGKLKEENKRLKDELHKYKQLIEEVTEEDLSEAGTYETFEPLEAKTWPKEIYKSAFVTVGYPLEANKEGDLLYWEENLNSEKINVGMRRVFRDRFPEIDGMEGKLKVITVRTYIEDKEGNKTGHERNVYRGEIDECPEDYFDILRSVKEKMLRGKRNKLSLYPPYGDEKGILIRKISEVIFRGTGIKCIIFTRSRNTETEKKRKEKREQTNRERDTDVLFIKQQGNSYADLLKTVKERVEVKSVAASGIRTIREARDGRMIIVVEKNKTEAVSALTNELAGVGNLEISKGGGPKKVTLTIRDIDSATSREEVRTAVCKEVENNAGDTDCDVSELRPCFGGNKAATIKLEKQKAKVLTDMRKIRIGLNWCPVSERVVVLQCFKCWQYGHTMDVCKAGQDVHDRCRNCGQEGHKAKDCSRGATCINCGTAGHRAGSGRCPEFQKALRRAKFKRSKGGGMPAQTVTSTRPR